MGFQNIHDKAIVAACETQAILSFTQKKVLSKTGTLIGEGQPMAKGIRFER